VTNGESIELFMHNAANAAADVHRVTDDAGLNATLEEILETSQAVFCPGKTDKEKALGIPDEQRENDYYKASVCVEEVDGAVAETGSIICTSKDGRAVQSSLLPAHHVAIVSSQKVYATFEDYFATCGDTPPTNITFITGPSRTADIELTLTIGVHGPERLSVIVY
jgi:L-lactate utilization protein LutC